MGSKLRIDRRAERAGAAEIPKAVLIPPWIYTAVPGNVFARTQRVTAIGEGDHSARSEEGRHAAPPAGIYMLHYPFRRYETFAEKIDRARRGFEASPQLALGHGWQLRRWIRLAQEGALRVEYDQQFAVDADLPAQIADGSPSRDSSILRFHDV
jgi:hypothetical protein